MTFINFTQRRGDAEGKPRRSRTCHAKPRRCKEGQGLFGGRARARYGNSFCDLAAWREINYGLVEVGYGCC